MDRLYGDRFYEMMAERIRRGEFSSKEELMKYMQTTNEKMTNNPDLKGQIGEQGITVDEDDLKKVTAKLLELYDSLNKTESALDLENVSKVNIDGKEYIKVKNADGSYTMLDDSMSMGKSFEEQFRDIQNASVDFNSSNGMKNAEDIVDHLEEVKETADLISTSDVNYRALTPEESQRLAAILQGRETEVNNFVCDPDRNIFINADTGETYYTHINGDGEMEVRKADELTNNSDLSYGNDDLEYQQVQEDSSIDQSQEPVYDSAAPDTNDASQNAFDQLDDFELEYIALNKLDSLTPEQQAAVRELMAERKEKAEQFQMTEQYQKENKPKQLVKKIVDPNSREDDKGDITVILLAVMTTIYGILAIMILSAMHLI